MFGPSMLPKGNVIQEKAQKIVIRLVRGSSNQCLLRNDRNLDDTSRGVWEVGMGMKEYGL